MANTSRFPVQGSPNQDKTGVVLTEAYQNPAFAPVLNIVCTDYQTIVQPGSLVGVVLAIPGPVIATPSGTGGTIAAGTYYYKVTALNANGETTASAEASATTTGATSSVALSWAAIPGATSYKVYKGTAAGGENAFFTTATNSLTDTGTAGTAGTVPTGNTAAVTAVLINMAAGSSTTAPFVGDEIMFMFFNPGTIASVVTLGANVAVTNTTLSIAAGKRGNIVLVWDGAFWVEVSRVVTV